MTKKIATLALAVGMMFSFSGFASAAPAVSSAPVIASGGSDDITTSNTWCRYGGGCIPVIDYMR